VKISTVLDSIDLGNMALPEFQRGYVWNRGQVRGLMHSLYRGYPVGGLLVWNTTGDAAATRGPAGGTTNTIKLLLDGQQRVTSLYGVIRGSAPAFFDGNEKAFTGLHFDVREENFEFYQPVKMLDDPLWIDVTKLFETDLEPFISMILDLDLEVDAGEYIKRLAKVLSIRERELHVEEISGSSVPLDEIVDIFNRLNSGGTKLSKGDLALAHICVTWPEARETMSAELNEWRESGFDFKLDWLLRVTNAVLTGSAGFTALRDVDRHVFETGLKRSIAHCDRLLNLIMDRLGLDHDRVLLGRYAFPVMARFLARHGSLSSADEGPLLFWYIYAGLWGRFSGSTESTLNQDLRAVDEDGVEGLLHQLEAWRGELRVTPEDFAGAERGSRFYPLLYLLSRVGGARDVLTGDVLSAHLRGRGSALELHHIFPKAMLQKRGYGRRERNAHGNFCFLTQASNQAIGARRPSDYLTECQQRHPGVLESQWIPMDPALWEPARYPDFLEARRELLAEAANSLLENFRIGTELPLGEKVAGSSASVGVTGGLDEDLKLVLEKCRDFGLPLPELDHSIDDLETGEMLACADAAWPNGLQEGLTEPLAYLSEPDEEAESRLGELGWRFFTDVERLIWHFEHILGIDIDGDGEIGEIGEIDDDDTGSTLDP